MAFAGLLPLLAEEQHLVIEEQMPLHGLKAGQVLHLEPKQRVVWVTVSLSVCQSIMQHPSIICLSIYHPSSIHLFIIYHSLLNCLSSIIHPSIYHPFIIPSIHPFIHHPSSLTLLWPFLWSVHTLKEPCISSLPRSLRFPCRQQQQHGGLTYGSWLPPNVRSFNMS